MNSRDYVDAFNMVKDYGARDSTVRTPEQTEIGLFWAYDRSDLPGKPEPGNGPPPVLTLRHAMEIALSASRPRRSLYYAAVSAVASVLGGMFGWFVGFAFWSAVSEYFHLYVPGVTHENMTYVGELYKQNGFWSIFAAAFTPIPFKVFTLAAGVFHDRVSLSTLIVASAFGRSARFFLVASAVYFFGAKISHSHVGSMTWVWLTGRRSREGKESGRLRGTARRCRTTLAQVSRTKERKSDTHKEADEYGRRLRNNHD